jgi:hypothetical protein
VPASAGEIIDKLTILEIKSERMTDPVKAANVNRELAMLNETLRSAVTPSPRLQELQDHLKVVNLQLWDIEDEIRDCERRQEFGGRFFELARAVYVTNDRRAALKKDVNVLLGSVIVEEKSYQSYG